ncbi:MAG: winged helix-turn-helix transcriptional regulator [Nitrospira sp.]|nr:winged helix-turn-helix transcriptional regulator [Nitrospira sp.]MBX3521186.1 winged helix-turn-helix transcriptional regulator [Xanthobacteraceae bacterium]
MAQADELPGAKQVSGTIVLDSERHIPYFFTYISNKLSYGAGKIYRELFGIGITEWRVMSVLAAQPNVGAHQICALLGIDKAVVSRSLRRLEELKLVKFTHTKPNGKVRPLALSRLGMSRHGKMIEIALEREQLLLSVLTAEEKIALVHMMKKLRTAVDKVNKWQPSR